MDNAPDLQTLDPSWTQRLPYHFARRHGVISACVRDGLLEVWAKPGVSSATLAELEKNLRKVLDFMESEDDAPIVRLINALLTQAVREGASDIHIEPFETRTVVRYRIDGVLRDIIEPQRGLHGVIVSRVKIMASLDIAEKRLPQDGRITLRLAGRPVDVRVSTVPTGHGE